MLLPNQSRFKAGALVGCWLAGQACSSALGQDFEKQTTAALDQDKTLYLHSTSVHADRNVFAKALRPDVSQAAVRTARRRKGGIGDLPADPWTLTWKLGPQIVRPVASDDPLSAETRSVGVASAAFAVEGVRLYGALGSERCALAGDVDRGTANGFLDPAVLVNYNLLDGWYSTSVPVINADWKAPSGQKWTVPIGASIGRFVRFGEMPVSMQAGYYYNIERPDGGSDWELRFQLRLLFPG